MDINIDASQTHKSGFVAVIGSPNVGKSTIVNLLVGERISIINKKAQTTRHKILGIVNGENFQIILSDTPGIVKPCYELQNRMMKSTFASFYESDLIVWVVDISADDFNSEIYKKILKYDVPKVVVLNKIDTLSQEAFDLKRKKITTEILIENFLYVSAINKIGILELKNFILNHLPLHPAYFPKDLITDKSERFIASEIIREKILTNYHQEVPYSCEVSIDAFIDSPSLLKISSTIYVERQSQKCILIGKNATAIKKISVAARKDMEKFFLKKIYLEQKVKVQENWRSTETMLNRFGY